MFLKQVCVLLSLVTVISALLYGFANAQRLNSLQVRMVKTEETIRDRDAHAGVQFEDVDRRLKTLERAVFGVNPPPAKNGVIEPWLINRLDSYGQRILMLERARMAQDGKK